MRGRERPGARHRASAAPRPCRAWPSSPASSRAPTTCRRVDRRAASSRRCTSGRDRAARRERTACPRPRNAARGTPARCRRRRFASSRRTRRCRDRRARRNRRPSDPAGRTGTPGSIAGVPAPGALPRRRRFRHRSAARHRADGTRATTGRSPPGRPRSARLRRVPPARRRRRTLSAPRWSARRVQESRRRTASYRPPRAAV